MAMHFHKFGIYRPCFRGGTRWSVVHEFKLAILGVTEFHVIWSRVIIRDPYEIIRDCNGSGNHRSSSLRW